MARHTKEFIPALDRPVVMVGMMGSGKTRIGRALADRLGVGFTDGDTEIEAAAGCTIADFFARHGEAAFRTGEHKVMSRLVDAPERGVIASGGGAVTHPDTRTLLKDKTYTVWLDAEVPTLVARTAGSDKRPLLNTGDPAEILARLLQTREAMYKEAACITVDANNEDAEATVDAIIAALQTRMKERQEQE